MTPLIHTITEKDELWAGISTIALPAAVGSASANFDNIFPAGNIKALWIIPSDTTVHGDFALTRVALRLAGATVAYNAIGLRADGAAVWIYNISGVATTVAFWVFAVISR